MILAELRGAGQTGIFADPGSAEKEVLDEDAGCWIHMCMMSVFYSGHIAHPARQGRCEGIYGKRRKDGGSFRPGRIRRT